MWEALPLDKKETIVTGKCPEQQKLVAKGRRSLQEDGEAVLVPDAGCHGAGSLADPMKMALQQCPQTARWVSAEERIAV
ncbi:hypothetical protein HispidOSU_005012 [Sigmodon hispidus]